MSWTVPVDPKVALVIWAPWVTGWRTTLPMTCDGSWKAPGSRASTASVWVRTWPAVIRVPSGMSADATTVGSSVATASRIAAASVAATLQQDDADEGKDGQEDPDKEDQPIRALQVFTPRGDVTGGTTVAPALRRATIPMG